MDVGWGTDDEVGHEAITMIPQLRDTKSGLALYHDGQTRIGIYNILGRTHSVIYL